MTEFRHIDTSRADGCYIDWSMEECDDTMAHPADYLFQDPDYREEDRARLAAFNRGEWRFIGIRARASILIVSGGVGTHYDMTSAGLYGIESDSGREYLESVFEEERETLLADLQCMGRAV